MKTMKKLASLLLALVLVFSLGLTAFADDSSNTTSVTHQIILKSSYEGHTYEAYQIFTGDFTVKDNQKMLTNIKWGANADNKTEGDPVGDEIFVDMTIEKAISLVDLSSAPFAESQEYDTTNKQYVISDLPSGYYLVKDRDNSLQGENASYTSYILELVETSEITPKSSAPTVVKKVKDRNDSLSRDSQWQDSADYDIGDEFQFQITATLAKNIDTYKGAYYMEFHDTLSDGLEFKEGSVDLMVDGIHVDANENNYIVNQNANSLNIVINDAKTIGAKNESVVTVVYTVTLNEKANIGSAGNPNTVLLEYANNPFWTGSGKPETGKTPEDKVIVFTYQIKVNKIHKTGTNENGEAVFAELNGAGFTLSKKDGYSGAYLPIGEELSGGTTFSWSGIDDGEYMLVETTTPEGYNTIDPIYFTVSAEHDINADNPALTGLVISVEKGEATFTTKQDEGTFEADILNQQGVNLPETGGMGTTLIYAVGGILVLAAVVLLVTKKRMSDAE